MVTKLFFGFVWLGGFLAIQGQVNETIYSSCKDAVEKACYPPSLVLIKVHADDGYVRLNCSDQMSGADDVNSTGCPGSGWTPVLGINGSSTNFNYDSNYWMDRETINPERWSTFNDHLDTGYDVKLPTYWSTSFDEVCIRVPTLTPTLIQLRHRASSMQSLIRGDEITLVDAGAAVWKGLAPDSASSVLGTSGCGKAGFNVGADANFFRARFGIVTDESTGGCSQKLQGIGAGLVVIDYDLYLASGYLDTGTKYPGIFFIYVR